MQGLSNCGMRALSGLSRFQKSIFRKGSSLIRFPFSVLVERVPYYIGDLRKEGS